MHYLFRLTVLCAIATVCAPAAFAQRNDQLIPNDLAVAIRRVMSPVEGTAWVYAYFAGSEMGDVAVVGIGDKGTSCPAMFRIVYPDSSPRYPQYHVTNEFGDCTDTPAIDFQRNGIVLKFGGWPDSPRKRAVAPTTYVFSNRTLRKTETPHGTKRRT
jgi:hypothetical protein